jgi:ABC-type branched-subunit amino acid transport system substrate-binding protein
MRAFLWLLTVTLCACPRSSGGQEQSNPRVQVHQNPAADEALAKANRAVQEKSRGEGIEALLEVRRKFPETTAGQDALYRAGQLAFEEGDAATARKTLGELVYENPLYAQIDSARLTLGLAALQMNAYQDAYQTLSNLVERLSGPDRKVAEDALRIATAGTQKFGDALKAAVKRVEDSPSGPAEAEALAALEEVVETKTNHLAIAEQVLELPTTHRAWPLLTFKLARVYYHLRDWPHLEETLKALTVNAPNSTYAALAKELWARVNRRATVRPRAVGALLPMTGRFKAFGEVALRGLKLALKGSDIELIVKDTQGDAAATAIAVEQLAFEAGVVAIVGPLLADDSRRAALLAEELQVPLLTMTRSEEITGYGEHVFRTMMTTSQQAEALAQYSVDVLGYKKFAILHPNTPFGVEMTNAFWTAIEKRGGELRGVESYDHDQKTFTDEAKRLVGRYYLDDRADYHEMVRDIREKNLDEFRRRKAFDKAKSNVEPIVDFEALLIPDAWQQVSLIAPALAVEDIITNACDKRDLERIHRTTGREKMKTVTLLGPSSWSSPKGSSGDPMLIERGGKYIQCSIYVDAFYEGSDQPATKAFVRAFREEHRDANVTVLDVIGYDTGAMVRSVLEKSNVTTRAAFRDRLATMKDFHGATGSISFDDQRGAQRPMFFLNITPKGLKEVSGSQKPEG